jgi:hypothetical protein
MDAPNLEELRLLLEDLDPDHAKRLENYKFILVSQVKFGRPETRRYHEIKGADIIFNEYFHSYKIMDPRDWLGEGGKKTVPHLLFHHGMGVINFLTHQDSSVVGEAIINIALDIKTNFYRRLGSTDFLLDLLSAEYPEKLKPVADSILDIIDPGPINIRGNLMHRLPRASRLLENSSQVGRAIEDLRDKILPHWISRHTYYPLLRDTFKEILESIIMDDNMSSLYYDALRMKIREFGRLGERAPLLAKDFLNYKALEFILLTEDESDLFNKILIDLVVSKLKWFTKLFKTNEIEYYAISTGKLENPFNEVEREFLRRYRDIYEGCYENNYNILHPRALFADGLERLRSGYLIRSRGKTITVPGLIQMTFDKTNQKQKEEYDLERKLLPPAGSSIQEGSLDSPGMELGEFLEEHSFTVGILEFQEIGGKESGTVKIN